jgi:hypothetical protein
VGRKSGRSPDPLTSFSCMVIGRAIRYTALDFLLGTI